MSDLNEKDKLIQIFEPSKTYIGSFIRQQINYAKIKDSTINGYAHISQPKYGDVFWFDTQGGKDRPYVVIKVLKKKEICICIPITTTENYHSTEVKTNSRFMKEGFYSYGMSIVNFDIVTKNFICVIEDKKNLRTAINKIKGFFI